MAGLDLGKQVGPLPLGGWIVVVAGGLGIGYLINRNMAKGSTEEPQSTQLTESGVGGGGGQFIYDPPQSGSTDTPPETNQSWGIKVLNWLIAGNHDPSVADQAVRKYLSGLTLTGPENAMIKLALIQFKSPPEPLPPTEQPPPSTGPSGEKPNAVTGLRVNPATRRNDIVWTHDGKNVTHFFVQAKVIVNGSTITAKVGSYPMSTQYVWPHFMAGGVNKNFTVEYLVVPWNGTVMGPPSRTKSNFKMN